jgi:PAS domain S-box-containing protein
MPREQSPSVAFPLAGGVHSTRAAGAESDRLLDLVHELETHRVQLTEQVSQYSQLEFELSAARDRYFELYEISPVAYLTLGPEGRVQQANLTAAGLLGTERRLLTTRHTGELFEPASAAALRVATERVLARDERASLELTTAGRNGAKRCKGMLARAHGGVLLALCDLELEAAPASAPRPMGLELESVLDAVDDGIATIDLTGTIQSCNRRFAELFARTPAKLLGTPLVRLIPGVQRALALGRRELEAAVGGRRFPVEVTITRPQRLPDRLVVVVADRTERRREQRERTEALLRFNQIAERITDAFYVAVASSGESLYVSPAFAQIYARPVLAHSSEPWPRLRWVHEADRGRVREAVQELWTGAPFDLEYRVVHPNGDVRVVHDRAFMLTDQRRVTGIVRDVTRERAMEEELRQVQRLEAMGTLASGVAHDFNNLLMGLGGCVQLALTRLDEEHPAQTYLRRASDAIVRGANLARQILRIGDTRRVPEGRVEVDVLLRAVREVLQSLLGDAVTLELQCQAPGGYVAAEPADLEQILMNLAGNARDAMPKGGKFLIRTGVQDNAVTLELADTGTGMSPSVRARVFEPFFTTKGVGKGTGLGLATVFALVRRLGGTVNLESDVGRGTRFRLSFPLVEAHPEPRMPESVPPPAHGATVLMVDDDPLVRLTVENHLEALGYRVLVASTTDEAIEVCEDQAVHIDVMVSDVMMPGMLGPELSRVLKKRNKKFPVVYMSAHAKEELVRLGHLTDDARLLAKPFDAMALSDAITVTLEEERIARENAHLRIFVIDDNRDIAEGLQEILQLKGHVVEIAVTADEALRTVPLFRPQIVLCDVDLGGAVDGFELTRTLRHDPRVAGATFIALTGFQSSECQERAEQAGINRVLTKPLVTDKLLRVLKEL